MQENKLTLLGKEYEARISRGSKDLTSGTLFGLVDLIDSKGEKLAQFQIQIKPIGEEALTLEPLFISTVEADFKTEMDILKKRELAAKGIVEVESTPVENPTA